MSSRLRFISLETVVMDSSAILLAVKDNPFTSTKKVSILPKGSIFEGRNEPPYFHPPHSDREAEKELLNRNYVPFQRKFFHFAIKEVLYNEIAIQEDRIKISQADFRKNLSLHEGYHLYGKRKISLHEVYRPPSDLDLDESDEVIIFINENLEFTYGNAFETTDKLSTIKELISQTNLRPPLKPLN